MRNILLILHVWSLINIVRCSILYRVKLIHFYFDMVFSRWQFAGVDILIFSFLSKLERCFLLSFCTFLKSFTFQFIRLILLLRVPFFNLFSYFSIQEFTFLFIWQLLIPRVHLRFIWQLLLPRVHFQFIWLLFLPKVSLFNSFD